MFDNHLRTRFVRTCLLMATALLLAVGLGGVWADEAQAGAHPHFSDGGAVDWYQTKVAAKEAARRTQKLILVDMSQPRCGACKMLMTRILTTNLGTRARKVAIGLHVDARRGRTDTDIVKMFRANLSERKYLPWIGFMTADGQWLTGFAPGASTTFSSLRAEFTKVLETAESLHRQGVANAVPAPTEGEGSTTKPSETGPTDNRPTEPGPSDPAPATPPSTTTQGSLQWFTSWNSAAAAARSQGKMVLVIAEKPSCSLCDKLKDNVIPTVSSQLARKAVVYTYNILRPEMRSVNKAIRDNLRGAYLMPLAGFLTPDARYLHGFFGSTTGSKLMSDAATAERRK